jgi:predicted AlkP superfamily phosphohydrolase/phosphomutase
LAARVVFLGICGASRDLLEEWSAAGILPNYRAAMARGITGYIDSMPGLYVGTTWPSFTSAVNPARHSRHYIIQLEPGTYRLRREPKGDRSRRPPFWQALSRAGKRLALFDIPHTGLAEGHNGIQVVEWGAHDGDVGQTITFPATLRDEIIGEFGLHPAGRSCDGRKSAEQHAAFRDRLVAGAGVRAEITRRYLARDDWDLFAQVWTESHCIGHQCWHLHDRSHPRYDAAAAAIAGDPVRDVYIAIDAAIGRVLETVGPETTVIVYTGHGMGPKYDAQYFLDEILLRLGYATAPGSGAALAASRQQSRHRFVDDALTRGWQLLPRPLKRTVEPLRRTLRGWVQQTEPARLPKIDPAASRCFAVPNNAAHGGIRINLAGREPDGKVTRGADYDALCERLADDIMRIVNLDTGRPIAERVLRTDGVYEGEYLDYLPDVLVEWNTDAPVFSIGSSEIGRLDGVDPYTRSGDHRKGGIFVAFGPRIEPGRRLERAVQVTDFGPTIARMLGVELPDTDGTPISEIAAHPIHATPMPLDAPR